MAIAHKTETYGLRDAKIRVLLTDNTGASAPTYGSPVDVPGVSSIKLSDEIINNMLRGDDKLLAVRSRLDSFEFTLGYVQHSLDVLEAALGGTTTDPDASTAKYERLGADEIPLVRVDALISDAALGIESVRVVLWKCRLTADKILNASTDEFGEFEIEGSAFPLESTDKMITIQYADSEQDLTVDV